MIVFYVSCVVFVFALVFFKKGSCGNSLSHSWYCIYIWLIHWKISRLNLTCVLSRAWFLLTSPSLCYPTPSKDCFLKHSCIFTIKNVHSLFPHFSPTWLPRGTHSEAGCLYIRYLSTLCWESEAEWKDVYPKVWEVFSPFLPYPSFIFCCSSNPPAISHALLCWRRAIKPFLLLLQKHIFRLFGH